MRLNSSYGILEGIPPSLFPVETSSLFYSGFTINTNDLSKELDISSLYFSFFIERPMKEVNGFWSISNNINGSEQTYESRYLNGKIKVLNASPIFIGILSLLLKTKIEFYPLKNQARHTKKLSIES